MKTVLMVDGSMEWRSTIAACLGLAFLKVVSVGSAEEAMDQLQAGQVDLMLLDAQLPGIDALGFLQSMRSQKRLASVPVLLLSDGGRSPDLHDFQHLGVERCLVKSSFSMGELICIVQETLRAHPSPAAA